MAATWTRTVLTYKDASGATKNLEAYVSDEGPAQFLVGGILYDALGNPIPSTLGNNGRGLNTVVLNDVATKGKAAVGDLIVAGPDGDLPVLLGAAVGAGIAQRTLVADNRMQGLTVTGDGRLLTLPIGPPEDQGLTTPVVAVNDTNVHQLIPFQAANIKIALWGLEVVNLSNTPNCVVILDGGTEIGRYAVPVNPGRPAYPQAGPLITHASIAMNYQLTTLPGANQLYLVPYWYKTKE